MPPRAAIVTGASRGIGRAIAESLAADGYELTLTARKSDALEETADRLRARGCHVEHVAGNLVHEDTVREVVRRHRERFGRLDLLVNNAGVGIGAAADAHETKYIDLQIDINLRSVILFYRESVELLKMAGNEHRQALVVNMASMAGKSPQPLLSVYSATKAAVIAYTRAMNGELNQDGVKSVAFCPGFVDTDMSDWVKDQIPPEEMVRTSDITGAVRFLLSLSPSCVVPEIVFGRPGEGW
jgi:NAD(P)-dependent dehydrogenase (short-subunit alcohol dehydrogenase family)